MPDEAVLKKMKGPVLTNGTFITLDSVECAYLGTRIRLTLT